MQFKIITIVHRPAFSAVQWLCMGVYTRTQSTQSFEMETIVTHTRINNGRLPSVAVKAHTACVGVCVWVGVGNGIVIINL